MRGFVLGLIVAVAGFAGYHYWKEFAHPKGKPVPTVDGGAPAKEGREKKKKRRRGAVRVARNDGPGGGQPQGQQSGSSRSLPPSPPVMDEPEPIKLSPADLKLVSQGDDLSRPDVIHMGDATDDSGSHELSQDEIDGRFRAKEDAILGCISRARPDEETYVPGRVTVKFRIQRTGNVRGVRVEAPAILQKGGIYGCIKGVVGGIRFPPSSGSQIVSYPFSLT